MKDLNTRSTRPRSRWGRRIVPVSVLVAALVAGVAMLPAASEPADPWDYEAFDCLNDRWNPLDPNGTRTGATPQPGTADWTAYDEAHVACTDQRDSDRNQHPVQDSARSAATYGQDRYRVPADHDGVRFHFEQLGVTDIPTVSSTEAYRPCSTDPGDCPALPDGLDRFDGPYPVVIVMHGVIAQDIHHRFNTQTFAENGYLAFGVDGYGSGYVPGLSGPNVQRCQNAGDVLDWLASPDSGEWGEAADLDRVAVVGHSQGGGCAQGYQGDPRVHTIISWDAGDSIDPTNCVEANPCQPIMHQRTDGGFSSPQSYADGYPETRHRGRPAFEDSVTRGLNFLHLNMRDTVHTDWNGYGTGLAGNRLFELASNYYNVAWLDLHLKGRLVVDDAGAVVTQDGRDEAAERAYRQAEAQWAFERLTSKTFLPDTIDKHNISMGFWDPEKAAASGDPLFGGNVPYEIEGTWTLERLSPFYTNYCHLSVPDHTGGSDGTPGTAATATSGSDGDMRLTGCIVDDGDEAPGGHPPGGPGGPPDRPDRPDRPDNGNRGPMPPPGPEPVADSPTVPNPTVTGPIPDDEGVRGGAYNRSRFPLADGYVEEEFFYEGEARDAAGATAPYKTRILVRRPADAAAFNGAVVLDWTNVTVPDDTDVSWLPMHATLMERGFVYVAVAAQRLGVEASPIALKQYDPVRYGSLSHPGDDFSFDIYSQAAEAILDPAVLGDLRPVVTRRLGVGASQSGGRLKSYINDWASEAAVFEGFMPQISGPDGVRRDLVPVLWLNSQSEIDAETVPEDSDLFRLWEMAGPAHAPHGYGQYQNSGYVFHESNGAVDIYDPDEGGAWGYQNDPGQCVVPNVFEPSYLYSAALVALDDWVRTGKAPPPRPRADRTGETLHHDELGNLVGGLRTPLIDVPIAKYFAGDVPPGSDACGQLGFAPLVGSTQMLTAAELVDRYGTVDAYISEFEAALESAVADGLVLPEGAAEMRRRLADSAAWVDAAISSAGSGTPLQELPVATVTEGEHP